MFIEMLIISAVSLLILSFRHGLPDISKFHAEIRGYKILLIMAAIEAVAVFLFKKFSDIDLLKILSITWLIYIPILVVSLINFDTHFMRLFFIGTLLNFIAISCNDFKMPVFISNMAANSQQTISYLSSGSDLIHSLAKDTTNLKFLCDIITLPPPYPFVKTISIGDILLLSGVFVFWQETYSSKIEGYLIRGYQIK